MTTDNDLHYELELAALELTDHHHRGVGDQRVPLAKQISVVRQRLESRCMLYSDTGLVRKPGVQNELMEKWEKDLAIAQGWLDADILANPGYYPAGEETTAMRNAGRMVARVVASIRRVRPS